MRGLRVGLLHGLYQNGKVFAHKTQPLRATLPGARIELEYFDGPHQVVPAVLSQSPRSQRKQLKRKPTTDLAAFKGWWNPHHSDLATRTETVETLQYLGTQLKRENVDGLVGFSQGGALAALLCSDLAQEIMDWSPAFVICVCAYESKLPFHHEMIQSGIDPRIQSLHIGGKEDKVVTCRKSRELSLLFHDAEYVENDIGHVFPHDEATLERIAAFVEQLQLQLSISCP